MAWIGDIWNGREVIGVANNRLTPDTHIDLTTAGAEGSAASVVTSVRRDTLIVVARERY
jgi:hypothetical protein